MKKKKMKKPYSDRAKIMIIINLVFILACTLFYSYRLQHFYYLEHPQKRKNMPIVDIVGLQENTVTKGDGLYKEDHTYYYYGKECKNYVTYAGMEWRIISVDEHDSFKLMCEESMTAFANPSKDIVQQSSIGKYLDTTFLEYIEDQEYLDTNITIVNENETYESTVGLLSSIEYEKAGGMDSFICNGYDFWLADDDGAYVDESGSIHRGSSLYGLYPVCGIRPVITIKGNAHALHGEGTKSNPFTLDKEPKKELSNQYIGTYVSYSGKTWRIVGKEEGAVKLLCCDSVVTSTFGENNYFNSTSGIGYYLNNDFLQTLEHTDYIVPHIFYSGEYDQTTNYDVNALHMYDEEMYVGLPCLGDLYICGNTNGFLATRTTANYGDVYYTNEYGNIDITQVYYDKGIYPIVYLDSTLVVDDGEGSKDDPYRIKE